MVEAIQLQEGDVVMAPYTPTPDITVYIRGVVLYVHNPSEEDTMPILVFMRDAYEAGGTPDATCRFKPEDLEFVARGVPIDEPK